MVKKFSMFSACLVVALLFFGPAAPASAAKFDPVYISGFTKLADAEIQQFKADPQNLLNFNVAGGLPLSAIVRGLVLSDPSLVDSIVGLVDSASPSQRGAIGTGLGQAVVALYAAKPQRPANIVLANYIQSLMTKSKFTDMTDAYRLAIKDLLTTALGAFGTSGGGDGGGSGPIGGIKPDSTSNGGPRPGSGSSGTSNPGGTFSGNRGGGSSTANRFSISPSAPVLLQ